MQKNILLVFFVIYSAFVHGSKMDSGSSPIVLTPGESLNIPSPMYEKTWLSRGGVVGLADSGSFLELRGKKHGRVLLNAGTRLWTIYVVSPGFKKNFLQVKQFLSMRQGLTGELKPAGRLKTPASVKTPGPRAGSPPVIWIEGELLRLKDFKDLVILGRMHSFPFRFAAKVPYNLRKPLLKYLQKELQAGDRKPGFFQHKNISIKWNPKLSFVFPARHPYFAFYQKKMQSFGIPVEKDPSLMAKAAVAELKILLVETGWHSSSHNAWEWNTFLNKPPSKGQNPTDTAFFTNLFYQSFQKWLSFFKAMESRGKAHILTEATLFNEHNQSSRLHSGGKVAIPHYHPATGAAGIQWKPYGVQLHLKTQLDRKDSIHIEITINISDVDHTYSPRRSPSLKTHSLITSLTLENGKTRLLSSLIRRQGGESGESPWIISRLPLARKVLSGSGKLKAFSRLHIILSGKKINP